MTTFTGGVSNSGLMAGTGGGIDSMGAYLTNFVTPGGTYYFVDDPKVQWASTTMPPFILERIPQEQQDFRFVPTAGNNLLMVQYMDTTLARRIKRPRWRCTFPAVKLQTKQHLEWLFNRNESFRITGVYAWAAIQKERCFQSPGDGSKWETAFPYILENTYTVYKENTAMTDGVEYTLNMNTGQITFTGTVASTVLVEATYLRNVCATITNLQVGEPNGYSLKNPRYEVAAEIIET